MSRTIISIWPMQENAYRALHIPPTSTDSNVFILEPGSIEDPFLLKVVEFNTLVYMGKGVHQTIGIPAHQTADDLVNQWRNAKNMPDDMGLPGIWVCSIDNPTLEQVKALPETQEAHEKQMQFAASKVREARLLAAQGEWRNITKLHLFMGKLMNVTGEPWQDFDAKAALGKVRCPYCDTPMSMTAAICGQCREICNLERYNQIRATQGLLPKAAPVPAAPKPS